MIWLIVIGGIMLLFLSLLWDAFKFIFKLLLNILYFAGSFVVIYYLFKFLADILATCIYV